MGIISYIYVNHIDYFKHAVSDGIFQQRKYLMEKKCLII